MDLAARRLRLSQRSAAPHALVPGAQSGHGVRLRGVPRRARGEPPRRRGHRAAFEEFLRLHPESIHRPEAESRLEELDWAAASEDGARDRLEAFVAAHPTSRRVPEARERLVELAREEQVAAERARAAALEAEAAAAFAQLDGSSSLAAWEAFLERFHATSLREAAGRRIEELADPTRADALRERMVPYLEKRAEDGRTRFFAADVIVTDRLENGTEGAALLFKQPDYSFAAVTHFGVGPSELARQQEVLRHMPAGEVYVKQVTRDMLLGDPEELDRIFTKAYFEMTRQRGIDFYETQLVTLAPDDRLVPDLEAPGGRNAGERSSQKFTLSIVYDADELADVLSYLPDASRSWALDRLETAGWTPSTERRRLVVALLSSDWSEALRAQDTAADLAAELWQVGHEDVQPLAETALSKLDPVGAPQRRAWAAAAAQDTFAGYDAYLADWPEGPHASEAAQRRRAFLEDDAVYEAALAEATDWSLRRFLEQYPGHARSADARRLLEGESIVDLLASGRILARSAGSDIETVYVDVRSQASDVLSVRVPVGTYFQAWYGSTQNMVATGESLAILRPDAWVQLRVPVACANRTKGIPGAKDVFTIRARPEQDALVAVLERLRRESAPYAVRQAATWIVTDDASYADLGLLRRGTYYSAQGARVIAADDAVRALQALDGVGVDVTARRLWRDRDELLGLVQDASLRAWLAE